jgi:pseudaminic acid synthase
MNFRNKKFFFKDIERPIMIAEISGNHNGKKSSLLNHIRSAAKAGADMIKIQTYEPKDITLRSKNKNFKINDGIWKGKCLWDLYKKAHTPYQWHEDAFKLAKKLNIILFSTPFSIEAVNFLEKLNNPVYKIASFEITDLKLIDYVARTKKPIIISTGLSTISEIKKAIKVIKKYHNNFAVLHCVSGYPTPENETNVNSINYLKKQLNKTCIGISDHTNDINSSMAAVALGAKLVEKHFKISNKIKSLDSKFSIDFEKFKELSMRSKNIYKTLGSYTKQQSRSEKKSLFLRRSIFTSKNISKGSKITKHNIKCLRPKIGIGSEMYFQILGKKIKKNKKKHTPIYQSDFR